MKFFDKLNTKANNAVMDTEANNAVKGYYAALAAVGAAALASAPVFGLNNIFTKLTSSLKNIYTQVVKISSVVAVTFIAICLIIRMVSKNQRSVEEATSWAKRIALTWCVLNVLGWILAYGNELVSGGSTAW